MFLREIIFCNNTVMLISRFVSRWPLTFVLQVGDGLVDHRWDGRLPVLLFDAVEHDSGFNSTSSLINKLFNNMTQTETHYCRLTPNCWVGRGGRGGGVFTEGGGPPFWAARNFSSCLREDTVNNTQTVSLMIIVMRESLKPGGLFTVVAG